MENNYTPRLYALTPIDQTEGLDSCYLHTITEFEDKGLALYSEFSKEAYPLTNRGHKHTHYLRPLPEGTRVLQPGEVVVNINSIEDLLSSAFLKLEQNQKLEYREIAKEFIQNKLAQMGE